MFVVNNCLTLPVVSVGLQMVRDWSGRGTVMRKGIEVDLKRGRFKVTRGGLYFINSRILYVAPTQKEGAEFTFTQRLVRQNPRNLITSVIVKDTQTKTCPSPRMLAMCHTSVMSTLAYLRRGDDMYIEVNHAPSIENTREDACYIDMFSID